MHVPIIRFIFRCLLGDTYTFIFLLSHPTICLFHQSVSQAHTIHSRLCARTHTHTHTCSANASLILLYFGYSQSIWFFAVIYSGKSFSPLSHFFAGYLFDPEPHSHTHPHVHTSQDLSLFIYSPRITKKNVRAMAHTTKFSSVTL